MLPDQFLRIQFRRVGREAFRDDLRMARKIVTDHASTIVDVSPIPDDRQRAADMLVNLLQKPHGVSGVGVGVVSQQGHIQVEALLFGADRDRADDRDPVMPIPRLQDRCFAARRIRSTHGGIEHIAGFIEEDQRRASVLGFFLSAEILHSSIARSPSHRVPVHGIQAFEASNSGARSSISARAPHDIERRNTFESGSLRAWKSTTHWASRGLSHLVPEGIPSHETEFPSDCTARRDERRISSRQVRSAPSCASGKAFLVPRQEFRQS